MANGPFPPKGPEKPNNLFTPQHHKDKSLFGQDQLTNIQGEIRALELSEDNNYIATAGTHIVLKMMEKWSLFGFVIFVG